MGIQWISYDDDEDYVFGDDDLGVFYQFTPDEIYTIEPSQNHNIIKCGIVVQGETDPRRVRFLEQVLQDGQASGPSSRSKDSPILF